MLNLKLRLFKRKKEEIGDAPDKVILINPEDGDIHLQLDMTISWVRPARTQTYDVYFGTVSGSLTLVSENQLQNSYNPIGLILDETYYFRIDAKNNIGTTQGDEISFSTWSADDIWTDGDNIPWTDGDGNYIPHERT